MALREEDRHSHLLKKGYKMTNTNLGTGSSSKKLWLPVVVVILGSFLWGSALSVVKIALEDFDPFLLVFLRMAIVFIVITPFVLIKFWPIRLYRKKDLILLVLLAFCDPVAFFVFEALALQNTSASQAGMMWALSPLLNVVLAWLIIKEKTTVPVLICFFAAIGGVVMLTMAGGISGSAPNPILGNFFELLSLCGVAGLVVIVRFLRGRYPVVLLVWFQTMIATVTLIPVLFLDSVKMPTEIRSEPTMALLYLALGVSLGAQSCSNFGIARLPVARFSALGNMVPVFGVLCGLIFLGETLTPLQWVACLIVFGAVLVSQRLQREPETSESEANAVETNTADTSAS